jgi:hypothetical protein
MSRPRYRPIAFDPFKARPVVRVAGRKFQLVGWADFAVRGFLWEFQEAVRQARVARLPLLRLYTLRPELRSIIHHAPIAGLVSSLDVHGEPEVQCLGLWLLGQCRSKRTIPVIAQFRYHGSEPVRKEAARALVRLSAWSELRWEQPEPSPRVRRFLEARPSRPFAERMARFNRSTVRVAPSEPVGARSRMPMFWSVPAGPGRPPKSAHYIRRLLEHIRALLRGRA